MTFSSFFRGAAGIVASSLLLGVSVQASTESLQQELKILSQKIKELEAKQQAASEGAKAAAIDTVRREVATARATTPAAGPALPPGYIPMPGTQTGIKIGGFVKGDVQYDGGQETNEAYDPHFLAINQADAASNVQQNTRISARMSRFNFATLSKTARGDVKTFTEMDFFSGLDNQTSASYTPRVRYAYGEWQGLLAGQTDTNFHDMKSLGSWLDLNGLSGGILRQPQIRYTLTQGDTGLSLAGAIERPVTDIDGPAPANLLGKASIGNSASTDGKSKYPDVTARLTWTGTRGHIALRALGRVLQVQNYQLASSTTQVSQTRGGWGVGMSGRLIVWNKTNAYGQWTFGQGVGKYLNEIRGFAALYNADGVGTNGNRFDTIGVFHMMAGLEHYWNETLKSNIGFSNLRTIYPNWRLKAHDNDAGLRKYVANIIWTPVKQVDIGLEVAKLERRTLRDYTQGTTPTVAEPTKATGSRYMASVVYRLD